MLIMAGTFSGIGPEQKLTFEKAAILLLCFLAQAASLLIAQE